MNKLHMECQIKSIGDTLKFTAYGNVKNVEDHAGDIALDGCYAESIEIHKKAGTMPILFWGHDHGSLPLGGIDQIAEDSKGFLIEGDIAPTSFGKDVDILMRRGDIKSMSVGYNVMDEEWDAQKGINYLKAIHVKEVSFVNFACNELSTVETIKSQIITGVLPSKREMEKILRSTGLSRKQSMTICSRYEPDKKSGIDIESLKAYSMFN